ncbi:MAG: glycoside hydrolase family 28 protein, partial [Bacteroidales bacterium]|nr:glycoside hydrolase family 28 protein [Bacteroidales bacterium]
LPLHQRTFTPDNYMRPQFVNFYRCNTALIEDVTLLNSPFWVIHPLFCDDLIVRGVTVRNHGPNGDGCDPESCKNVLIEDCVFDTGDDCIAIKSGRNADGRKWNVPSENIVVRRCHMADGHGGIVIGSEISGGYRNLFVEDCTMDSPNLDRVVRIKTSNCRGGVIENIYVRNIEVGECREAVVRINLAYEPRENCDRSFDPIVRNVYLENINCQKSQYGIYLHGLDNVTNIDNINLKDCNFNGVTSKGNFMAGLVGSVSLDNVKINGKKLKELKAQKASK